MLDQQRVRTPARRNAAAADRAPRLLYFYSPRSGRSRRTDAFLAQVLQHRHNHDTFVLLRVDVDDRPDLAERFRVTAAPTLLVVDDRRIRLRLSEPKGKHEIATALAPWLR